nr:hypothetical protein [Tanacetum cinerariifolium]
MSMLAKTQDHKVKRRSRLKDKDLKISDEMTKSKYNDKGSRSKIAKHEGKSLQRRQRQRQELNDKRNRNELTKECHNELTSGEILADLFTKAVPVERFKYLVKRLGMRCLTPAELEALANESA